MIRLKATTTAVLLEKIANIYRDDIQKIYGMPKKILSNSGSQFALQFMKNLGKVLEAKILSMAYHPQTDSQMERINQEVEAFLWYYINYQQNNWTKWLSVVEFQYNNKKHLATGYISFELNNKDGITKTGNFS